MIQANIKHGGAPIGADFRWIVGKTGIGRFATEVLRRLNCRAIAGQTPLLHPADPLMQGIAVRKSGCKVYFSPGFNPPIRAGVPNVFTIHDLIHLRVKSERSLSKTMFYNYLVKPAARMSPAVLTVSEYSKRQIVEWADLPPERVHVVGNGVSGEFCPDGKTADLGPPYLLYVGNYKPHKNIGRLVKAFATSTSAKDFTLCFVGRERQEISLQAHSLGICRQVRFLGDQTNEGLACLYRGAQALLCPSIEEGFGLPVLEAMACGVPSLVASGHAAEEVADGAAIKCNALEVDSIAEAIDKVTGNSSLRSELIARGLKRAKYFSWDEVAQRVSHAIDSI